MKLKVFSSALALTATLFFSSAAVQAQEPVTPVDVQALLSTIGDIPQQPLMPSLQTQEDAPLLDGLQEYEQQLLEYYYSSFATYSLTPEEQAAYLALIQEFWPGVYDNMQPWEVNDEMADVINTMVETIADCSQALATVNSFVGAVKTFRDTNALLNPAKWAKFIKKYKEDLLQGLGLLRYNRRHKHCVTVASANWRSTFEMAYGQYWWY